MAARRAPHGGLLKAADLGAPHGGLMKVAVTEEKVSADLGAPHGGLLKAAVTEEKVSADLEAPHGGLLKAAVTEDKVSADLEAPHGGLLKAADLGAPHGGLLKAAVTEDKVSAALGAPHGGLLKPAETEDKVSADLGAPHRGLLKAADLGAQHGGLLKAAETEEKVSTDQGAPRGGLLKAAETEDKTEAKILIGPHEDLESKLEGIEKLRSSIQFLGCRKGFKSSDDVDNNLLAKAISKQEDEFKHLLSFYRKPLEAECLFDCLPNSMRPSPGSPGHEGDPSGKNPSSSHHSEPHNNNNNNNSADAAVYKPPALIPQRILAPLHDLAQQIVGAGHEEQLLKIYRDARSSVLEESLQIFGVEKLNNDDVEKLQQEMLEAKVTKWIHLMRIAVKLLFAGERKVCDQILEGFDSLSEQCFAEVTRNSVFMLLSFGEAITESKRSVERSILLLDMYELMRELHSEIETLFKGKATEIREAAIDLTKRLAQTALETTGEFEEAIEKYATMTALTDGSVHPLTSYVFNYVCPSIFKQLHQKFEGGDYLSRLAPVAMRIMQALQTNLDGKSKQYRDPALRHLFLMNNILYIVRSVQRSESKDLLGDDWVQEHGGLVEQHANQYKRNAWTDILQCISIRGLIPSDGWTGSNSALTATVKDRFKMFNDMFKELHQKQSRWTVPDTEYRVYLQLAVAQVLLLAYRLFVGHFGHLVESQKNSQKYIKYTEEDLDRMLGELFEGQNMNKTKRKRVAD